MVKVKLDRETIGELGKSQDERSGLPPNGQKRPLPLRWQLAIPYFPGSEALLHDVSMVSGGVCGKLAALKIPV